MNNKLFVKLFGGTYTDKDTDYTYIINKGVFSKFLYVKSYQWKVKLTRIKYSIQIFWLKFKIKHLK